MKKHSNFVRIGIVVVLIASSGAFCWIAVGPKFFLQIIGVIFIFVVPLFAGAYLIYAKFKDKPLIASGIYSAAMGLSCSIIYSVGFWLNPDSTSIEFRIISPILIGLFFGLLIFILGYGYSSISKITEKDGEKKKSLNNRFQ